MIDIIPTVVPDSFERIAQTIDRYSGFASAIHIDIVDGIFAPNKTWLPSGEQFDKKDGFVYEAHLMVSDPRTVGLACIESGAQRIIGHLEAMGDAALGICSAWKEAGASEVGLGVLFGTPIERIDPYVAGADVVQMMSIASIGVQGIPYEASALQRIAALHATYPDLLIADDGGVGESNIAALVAAGVRRFCVGSALSRAADPRAAYARLMTLAKSAI